MSTLTKDEKIMVPEPTEKDKEFLRLKEQLDKEITEAFICRVRALMDNGFELGQKKD